MSSFNRVRFILLSATISCLVALGGSAAAAGASTVGQVFPAEASAASGANYSATPSRVQYVILQAWETNRLHQLKAQNPSLKVLVYKEFGFSAQGTSYDGVSASGVNYAEAPESWFLKNTRGQRFTSNGYSWLYAMDIGNPEYQKKWADNVIAEMETQGWDGVFMDDVNPTMKYAYDPGSVAKYPTDASYSAAVESALAYIGPKIQEHGKLAIPNMGAWVEYPETCDRWLQYVSGGLDEMFVKWGSNAGEGYRDVAQWRTQLEEVKYAAAHGKAFLGFTQGATGDTQAARFGYATMLLGSEGNSFYAYTPNYAEEEWLAEYEYELGEPTAAEYEESSGVHRRAFESGLVLVNPTSSTRTVSLGGTYSGSGLSGVTSAMMAPDSGLVLTGGSEARTSKPKTATTVPTGAEAGSIKVVATSVGPEEVALNWSTSNNKVRSYRVVRNSQPISKTSRHKRVERHVSVGRVYRYRIQGLDRRDRVVAVSRRLRVRPSLAQVGLQAARKVS